MIHGAGEWGAAGRGLGWGAWGSERRGKRNGAPPLSAEEKALGSVSSCLTPPVEEMGSLSPHSFQGPRGCSRLSLWKKLLPNSYVLIMMAQEGAALTILGRKPVAGGSGRGQRSGPRGPQIHQGLDTDRHTHTHSETPTCKEPPGARLGPDPLQQQPGGDGARGRHCKPRLSPVRPCCPAALPHTRQGPAPLTASTAPSATWR